MALCHGDILDYLCLGPSNLLNYLLGMGIRMGNLEVLLEVLRLLVPWMHHQLSNLRVHGVISGEALYLGEDHFVYLGSVL